jgi:hypothetical protein
LFVHVNDDHLAPRPSAPIPSARIEPLMSNCEDHDLLGDHPVRDRVREAAKHVPLRSPAGGPPRRRAKDQVDSLLNVGRESGTQTLPRVLIPENSMAKIVARCA